MNILLIFLLTLLIHEFGHWVGFKIFGFDPDIKITWYAIFIGDNVLDNLRGKQFYIVSLLGIITGYLFLSLMNVSKFIYFIYFLSCFFDFSSLITLIILKTKKPHRINMHISRIKKYEAMDYLKIKKIIT